MKKWTSIILSLCFIFLLAYWLTPSNRTSVDTVKSKPVFKNEEESRLPAETKPNAQETSSTITPEGELPQRETFPGTDNLTWKRSYQDDDYIVYDPFYEEVRVAPFELRYKKLPNGQMTLVAGQSPSIEGIQETFPQVDISSLKKHLYDEHEEISDIQEVEKQWTIDPMEGSLVPILVLAISNSKGTPHGELWHVHAKNQNILSKVQRGRH